MDFRNIKLKREPVFAEVIKYIKNLAFEAIQLQTKDLKEEHIRWILTLLAIWTDTARQIMANATVKAGINREDLQLVLEPEAASLFCSGNAVVDSTIVIERSQVHLGRFCWWDS